MTLAGASGGAIAAAQVAIADDPPGEAYCLVPPEPVEPRAVVMWEGDWVLGSWWDNALEANPSFYEDEWVLNQLDAELRVDLARDGRIARNGKVDIGSRSMIPSAPATNAVGHSTASPASSRFPPARRAAGSSCGTRPVPSAGTSIGSASTTTGGSRSPSRPSCSPTGSMPPASTTR